MPQARILLLRGSIPAEKHITATFADEQLQYSCAARAGKHRQLIQPAYWSRRIASIRLRALRVGASPKPLHTAEKQMGAQSHWRRTSRGQTREKAFDGVRAFRGGQCGEEPCPELDRRLRHGGVAGGARCKQSLAGGSSDRNFTQLARWVSIRSRHAGCDRKQIGRHRQVPCISSDRSAEIAECCGKGAGGGNGIGIDRIHCAAHTSEPRARSPKELFKVLIAALARVQRCARRDNAELDRIGGKPDSIQQNSKQIGYFSSRCATIGMQFVNNKVEDIVAIRS